MVLASWSEMKTEALKCHLMEREGCHPVSCSDQLMGPYEGSSTLTGGLLLLLGVTLWTVGR